MLLTVTNVTISNHVLDRILTQEAFRAQMFPRLVDNFLELIERNRDVILVCFALLGDCLRQPLTNSPKCRELRW